jgi:hypothetical protein
MVIPLLALAIVAGAQGVAPTSQRRTSFFKVLRSVWVPGLGLAFASVGFGVITAFIALLFATKSWGNASLAFTAFGLAFIGARIFFGHLPDKIGGAKVALVCVIIEAAGQLLIWGADSALTAYLGAALTGFGYSLAFPGFGVEAIKRAPPQSRSLAMGAVCGVPGYFAGGQHPADRRLGRRGRSGIGVPGGRSGRGAVGDRGAGVAFQGASGGARGLYFATSPLTHITRDSR